MSTARSGAGTCVLGGRLYASTSVGCDSESFNFKVGTLRLVRKERKRAAGITRP